MTLIDRLAIQLAMVFGIGRLPKAPGTFGSLPGLALGLGVHRLAERLAAGAAWGPAQTMWTLLLLSACILASLWIIARAEAALGTHDDQRIVVDEVIGQAAAVAFAPVTVAFYAAGFVLFRVLDIGKPLLIGVIDRRLPGAAGTLLDDVLAGFCAAGLLWGAQCLAFST